MAPISAPASRWATRSSCRTSRSSTSPPSSATASSSARRGADQRPTSRARSIPTVELKRGETGGRGRHGRGGRIARRALGVCGAGAHRALGHGGRRRGRHRGCARLRAWWPVCPPGRSAGSAGQGCGSPREARRLAVPGRVAAATTRPRTPGTDRSSLGGGGRPLHPADHHSADPRPGVRIGYPRPSTMTRTPGQILRTQLAILRVVGLDHRRATASPRGGRSPSAPQFIGAEQRIADEGRAPRERRASTVPEHTGECGLLDTSTVGGTKDQRQVGQTGHRKAAASSSDGVGGHRER